MRQPNRSRGIVIVLLGGVCAVCHAVSAFGAQLPDTPGAAAGTPASPEARGRYSYDAGERRDPFVNPLSRRDDAPPAGERPYGLAGLGVNEVVLRGVVVTGGTYLAVLEAPDASTYIVRTGHRLHDGSVQRITAETIVFLAAGSEVRQSLRGTEDGP